MTRDHLFHRFVLNPTRTGLFLCGLALGLAQLAKFTALLLYPVFLLLAVIHPEHRLRRLGSVLLILLISLIVIDAGYLFEDIGHPLGSFRFESHLLKTAAGILPAGFPAPLPAAYLEGLDALQRINDVGEYPEYLLGRWSREGSPAYYLIVILYKTPLPTGKGSITSASPTSATWTPRSTVLPGISRARTVRGSSRSAPTFSTVIPTPPTKMATSCQSLPARSPGSTAIPGLPTWGEGCSSIESLDEQERRCREQGFVIKGLGMNASLLEATEPVVEADEAPGLVLSLFSGAGGLDLGLRLAGWPVLAQVEMEPDCVATLQAEAIKARRKTQCFRARIEEIDPRRLRRQLGLKAGQLGLIAGGPPCQPFTTTGLRQGIHDRRASSAFPSYLKYVEELMPEALLLENVDGMLSAALRHRPLRERGTDSPKMAWEERKGSFLYWFLCKLAALGYSVAWGVTEAADHGVPQFRQRAVLIGIRHGEPCFLPAPSHGQPGLSPFRTLREALTGIRNLGPIQPLSERKKDVFRLIPPGGNWRNLSDSLRRQTMGAAYFATGGKSGWWRRLSWDEPAPTILGMPDHSSTALIHPDELRCLSLNECAAVQTFPGDICFGGSPRSGYQQVGNAVPPLLACRLGLHIAGHLAGERAPAPQAPDWRRASANRRIGTHGWVTPGPRGPKFHILAKPREDSVWVDEQHAIPFV